MHKTPFDSIRSHYPVFQSHAYFETAATGAIPDYVDALHQEYQNSRLYRGGTSLWEGMTTFEMIDWSKTQMAALLGCESHEIAFGENTSQMFALFSSSLPLRPRDNVIMTDTTFISMAYAWDLKRQNEGIELRYVKSEAGQLPVEAILGQVDENTRVISLNHVESDTGVRHDLAAIGDFCRRHDILLAVDAAQSAGIIPVDVKSMQIDFLAGNNYKWMQGYCGVGYGYFGPRAMATLKPTMAGWRSHKAGLDQTLLTLDLHEGATRFEYGYPNTPGIYSLGKVAETYLRLGSQAIEEYVLSLVSYLRTRAQGTPGLGIWNAFPAHANSQIVILTVAEHNLEAGLLPAEGVLAAVRDGAPYGVPHALRLGLHYYNNVADIDRLFDALESLRR